MKDFVNKIHKTYLKMLMKYAQGKIKKAKKLEQKLIQLELQYKKL